ncbi:MAG: EscU/YscU/HrcU family type III secretion system export apparatus switch protein [Halomonas sp.]|nr:EscU/YscU/HrcU family type III secretion system export apparatus switch protein [Halomonas sp.]
MSDDRKAGRPVRRQAVALAYGGDQAPTVLAKGYGELAERIVDEARAQGIFIHDAPELVGLLMQVDLDARIPPSLYQVIAELLAWLHEVETHSR